MDKTDVTVRLFVIDLEVANWLVVTEVDGVVGAPGRRWVG
jgi:hypothetical protein